MIVRSSTKVWLSAGIPFTVKAAAFKPCAANGSLITIVKSAGGTVVAEPAKGSLETTRKPRCRSIRFRLSRPPVATLSVKAGMGSTDSRMACRISRKVDSGAKLIASAAAPATWGLAKEVPLL